MNEYSLDSTSGKKPTPSRLDREVSSNKKSVNQPDPKISFQKVLKDAAVEAAASPEIRQGLVQKYRISLANGTYEVKAEELAEKMIQKIRESKTRGIF